MTPIALLYDIHGNLPALQAVLEDAQRTGVGRFLLGGDYALFGAWPAQTVSRLHALQRATWIRGNAERWVAAPLEAPADNVVQSAICSCRDALGPELVAKLAALPEQARLDRTRCWHGSPVSDVRSFLPDPDEDEDQLLDGVIDSRLVFGHTHLPFRRIGARGVELVNPGSVGMPFDGDPRAAYAILHRDETRDGEVEHRRVAYDHEASAAAVHERFGDSGWAETVARRIATAQV